MWTKERREAQAERMRERHALMHRVRQERIRRDAERAAKLNKPVDEQADDIIRMMFGNGGAVGPILKGKE